ncbi:GNAT family protein [Limnohabitans sp.]|uniref:GNAT family N-acetyltransferase n=1 Tax=Limnohabitans sp. TaxID=1907725 RepID=UPI00286EC4B1|nr:GNAT family protein [Limnohabitans sp.]
MYITQSKNIFVRLPLSDDITKLTEWYRNAEHMEYVSGNTFYSSKMLREVFNKTISCSHKSFPDELLLICELKNGGDEIGYIYYPKINWLGRSAEIQIALDSSYRNKIYGIEIALLSFYIAYRSFNIKSLYMMILSENVKMKRMLQRVNFRHCGTLKQHTYKNDKMVDVEVYQGGVELMSATSNMTRFARVYNLYE